MEAKDKFIGSGMTFPILLNPLKTSPIISSGESTLIHSSIGIIINWPKRRRWFNEEFGCRIEETLEEPNDAISRTLIRVFIKEALEKWEKRIVLKSIKTQSGRDVGQINVSINYNIRNTKIEETVIFPFYTDLKY